MSRRSNRLLVAAAVSAIVMASIAPASASGVSKTDGNDTPGPLDLAGIRVIHGTSKDTIQIKTLSAFTSSQLDGVKGWFEIDLNLDSDKSYEKWVVVFYDGPTPVGVLGQGKTGDWELNVRRVDKRTMQVQLPYNHVGNVTSYDFAAASVWTGSPCSKSNPCVDTIPNSYPLLRSDFTPPTVSWTSSPELSTEASDTATFPVGFSVADNSRGSGLSKWVVQQKQEDGNWTTAASGKTASNTVDITGIPGEATSVRIRATDKQGNTTVSSQRTTVVPLDDRDPAITYTLGSPVLHNSADGAYMGTTSGLANTTITATFPTRVGKRLCVIVDPTTGANVSMNVYYDGTYQTIFYDWPTTPMRDSWCTSYALPSATTVVKLEVNSSDEFILDGIAFL